MPEKKKQKQKQKQKKTESLLGVSQSGALKMCVGTLLWIDIFHSF